MSTPLHSFSELASALGRFEMETTSNQGNWGTKSLIGLDQASALRLFEAESILACEPETNSAARRQLLDDLGERGARYWNLRAPVSPVEMTRWKKLLAADQALIFVATDKDGWLENLIGNLHVPYVAAVPSMSLTESWLSFERKAFREASELLHISVGATRKSFTFVGTGALFDKAVALASHRPPMMWGYPPDAFKETLRSRKLIFPAKKDAAKSGA